MHVQTTGNLAKLLYTFIHIDNVWLKKTAFQINWYTVLFGCFFSFSINRKNNQFSGISEYLQVGLAN